MNPGLHLRQARERLGLTYREVERSSFELASQRGRPEFILHISRLADIENRSVVPSLHKVYTLAVIYHLNPLDIFRWYEVPVDEFFGDGAAFDAPRTHLMSPPGSLRIPLHFDPAFDPKRTEFLSRMVEQWGRFEGVLTRNDGRHRYGYIGLSDRRMTPILRPGSIVLLDISMRRIDETDWSTEYDRPMYFVELRDGYRCGWFHKDGAKLVMQPHPLSRCLPESWCLPSEAEVVGRVIGVVTRLNEPWKTLPRESSTVREDSSKRVL
ncbi:MAG TPA: helix-turn-helix transcriptional regulator [Candidatus Acidoferrum sp.]|jgi:transcriptional regulator with XRE-family HTH domain